MAAAIGLVNAAGSVARQGEVQRRTGDQGGGLGCLLVQRQMDFAEGIAKSVNQGAKSDRGVLDFEVESCFVMVCVVGSGGGLGLTGGVSHGL